MQQRHFDREALEAVELASVVQGAWEPVVLVHASA